jgi:hypothetical protein
VFEEQLVVPREQDVAASSAISAAITAAIIQDALQSHLQTIPACKA